MSWFVFVMLSTTFSVIGQLTLKYAMGRIARASDQARPLILRIALSPWVVVGLIIYATGVLFWLMAMSSLEVSFLYPFASLSYVGIVIGSYLIFKERITRTRLLGIAIIIGGLMIVGLSANL